MKYVEPKKIICFDILICLFSLIIFLHSQCSKDCQIKSWKEYGHKEHCRKEGEIKSGDFVSLHGLKKKPELNRKIGHVVCVLDQTTPVNSTHSSIRGETEGTINNDDERWKIMFDPDGQSLSIAKKNLKQTRPFDCVQKQNMEITAKDLATTQSQLDQLHLAKSTRSLSESETNQLKILTLSEKMFSSHKDKLIMNDWFATTSTVTATAAADGAMASWKNDKNGKFVFMGIIQYPHKHKEPFKLNDPRNLNGSGHVMDYLELWYVFVISTSIVFSCYTSTLVYFEYIL